jgi:hypothetical protein
MLSYIQLLLLYTGYRLTNYLTNLGVLKGDHVWKLPTINWRKWWCFHPPTTTFYWLIYWPLHATIELSIFSRTLCILFIVKLQGPFPRNWRKSIIFFNNSPQKTRYNPRFYLFLKINKFKITRGSASQISDTHFRFHGKKQKN